MQVHTLPTEQATPALTDSFSRGHDPSAHACKARPLTVVGWTSLSVNVNVIELKQRVATVASVFLRKGDDDTRFALQFVQLGFAK